MYLLLVFVRLDGMMPKMQWRGRNSLSFPLMT